MPFPCSEWPVRIRQLQCAIETMARFGVYAKTQTGIADHGVELVQLLSQRLGYLHLREVFEAALSPSNLAYITPFLERTLCFIGMLFLIGEKVDFGGVALEDMGDDVVYLADASGATCDWINAGLC